MSRLGAPFRPLRRSSPADLVPSAEVQKLSSDLGEAYRRINELEAAIREHERETSAMVLKYRPGLMRIDRKLYQAVDPLYSNPKHPHDCACTEPAVEGPKGPRRRLRGDKTLGAYPDPLRWLDRDS